MSDTTYNGWSNYETWNVALWLDTEEWSQNYWHDEARECYERATATSYSTRQQVATHALADQLKDEHEEGAASSWRDGPANVYMDLLNAALSEVNWDEIAGHYVDEAAEEIDLEEAMEAEEAENAQQEYES